MFGALMAGLAFGTAGTAAAHAIQYPVGALTHTAHGAGVACLMPYVMAIQSRPAPPARWPRSPRRWAWPMRGDSDAANAERAIVAVETLFAPDRHSARPPGAGPVRGQEGLDRRAIAGRGAPGQEQSPSARSLPPCRPSSAPLMPATASLLASTLYPKGLSSSCCPLPEIACQSFGLDACGQDRPLYRRRLAPRRRGQAHRRARSIDRQSPSPRSPMRRIEDGFSAVTAASDALCRAGRRRRRASAPKSCANAGC